MGLLITIIVIVLILALVMWVLTLMPIDGKAKQILQIALGLVAVVYLLMVLLGHVPQVHFE